MSPAINPFAEFLDAAAAAHGDKPYLVELDASALSFAEFRDLAHVWAGHLLERGVRPGDRVAALSDNRSEFVLLWYACQLVGATVVPFNPHLPQDSQRHLLRLVRPVACFLATARPATGFEAALVAEGVPSVRLAPAGGDRLPPGERPTAGPIEPAELPAGHASQIIFTSGTTGRPKGAIQTSDLLSGLLEVPRRTGLTGDDRLLTSSPLFHGLGQSWFQYGLALGATVVLAPRFSASDFWNTCRDFGITAMQHVGAVLSFLLRRPPSDRDRDHQVRLSFGVGAPVDIWRAFEERFGVAVVEFYGMTEAGLVAFNDPPGRSGSVGRPSSAVEIRLVDDAGRPVPTGTPGEAWTRAVGPGAKTPEYFGDPEATASASVDGWFRTGDLLRQDADGYLYFVGRKRESLRRRGENIVPEDIERSVVALDDVDDCAAVGVPSPHGDDDIKLCLVPARPLDDDGLRTLARAIHDVLPATMRPRFVALYDALPYTPTNKVQRLRLRADEERPLWDVDAGRWVAAGVEESLR